MRIALGSTSFIGPLGVAGTVLFTVYGQLVIKWRLDRLREDDVIVRGAGSLARVVIDPWILSGFVSAGVAAIAWIVALSHLRLSVAYPFMSISFVLVLLASGAILGESVSTVQIVGITVVAVGLAIGASQ